MLKTPTEWILFKTPIGVCGLCWNHNEIVSLLLPEKNISALEKQMVEITRCAKASVKAPLWVKALIHQIQLHLSGSPQDFQHIPLDFNRVSEFQQKVFKATRNIPPGETRTYKQIAQSISNPKAARAVGQALGKNIFLLLIPCHRVLGSGKKLGGFSAPGGLKTKIQLLRIETPL